MALKVVVVFAISLKTISLYTFVEPVCLVSTFKRYKLEEDDILCKEIIISSESREKSRD